MEAHEMATEQTAAEPIYITVREAERIFSLPYTRGYQLCKGEWAPFVVTLGERGIRLDPARLLEWAARKQGKAA
jgi:hypothetical protein